MRRLLLLLPLALLAAPMHAQTVRDSAGIRIVQNPARARAPVAFQLGTTPMLDIGGAEEDPDDEFQPNQGYLRAAWLANGGLAVIDVVRVQFFDARGTRLKIAGRSGAGPEEFLYLLSICRTRGDTIVVSDARNGRIGVLAGTGSIVRTVRTAEHGHPPFSACFDDGTMVFERSMPGARTDRRTSRLTRVRLDGTAVSTIGDFQFPPFESVTQAEPSVIAWQQRLYIGDPSRSEVRIYTPAGRLTMIVRSADALVRITGAEAEARMRATIPRNTPPAEVAERMANMRAAPQPDTWPAYRRMHVDARGRLWVQDYTTERGVPDAWTAFDVNGRLLGRLVIPAPAAGERRPEVIAFGADNILLRRADADGFAHLVAYPIRPVRR